MEQICIQRLFCVLPSPKATYKIITWRLNINYNCLDDGESLILASSYI